MRRIIFTLSRCGLAVAFILIFGSCNTQPTGVSGGGVYFVCEISPFDVAGNPVTDRAGFRVQLDGTPYFALSDTAGVARMYSIISGTYDIRISKPGFVDMQFIGWDLRQDSCGLSTGIGQAPDFGVTSLAFESATESSILIRGTLTKPAPGERSAVAYFGLDSSVSNLNSVCDFPIGHIQAYSTSFSLVVSPSVLREKGLDRPGTRVYVAAYGVGGGSYIYDWPRETLVRTDVSPEAGRTSFIMN